jgi:phosphopantetheinyl transferase
VAISYNEVGAPQVDRPDTHISVAHGAGCVAVAISNKRVGVDIESTERNFGKVSSRYMSDIEQQLCSDSNWEAAVWAAKEALYKLYGKEGVELRDELQIEAYDAQNRQLKARLMGENRASVDIEFRDGNIVLATAYFE